MLKLLPILALACVLSFGSALQAAELFSKTIEDLPLMEGMIEHEDGVQFSTPAGRIAEVIVDAPYGEADIFAFYKDTLPQLGWTIAGQAAFKREGEVLKLTIEGQGNDVAVRFELAPQD